MKRTMIFLAVSGLLVVFGMTGCVTYRNFPAEYLGKVPEKSAGTSTVTYSIVSSSLFGGVDRLNEVFNTKSPFKSIEKTSEKSMKGTHIEIVIGHLSPSLAAIGFGYLSLSTLTFLPMWSTKDGYEVFYEVYQDGTKVKSYSYEVRRKLFVWIGMLPFSWVNFITYSEEDAFEATAYKFFEDSKGLIK